MAKNLRVLLTGGGTAGHIVPTLSIAKYLQDEHHAKIRYIGEYQSMESVMVQEAGLNFRPIYAGKLRRYFSWRNCIDPFFILMGFFQSLWYLSRFSPDIVFAKGGYVCLPVGIAAWILRIPLIIHESDLHLGLTNKILSYFADRVLYSFEKTCELSPSDKAYVVGSPIRQGLLPTQDQAILWKQKTLEITGFSLDQPLILILGGSLGAQSINQKILELHDDFPNVQWICQMGKGKIPENIADYPRIKAYEFLSEEYPYFLSTASLIIARAGANTLFELATAGKPVIFIPLGAHQSRGDQIDNAKVLESAGACRIVLDHAPIKELESAITEILQDKTLQQSLRSNIQKFAPEDAVGKIGKMIVEVASEGNWGK